MDKISKKVCFYCFTRFFKIKFLARKIYILYSVSHEVRSVISLKISSYNSVRNLASILDRVDILRATTRAHEDIY